AEWIWACRGSTPWVQESNFPELAKVAWSYSERTCPVGQLKSNPFGLYDVYGNVWELCLDGFDVQAYTKRGPGITVDPLDPEDIGAGRVLKGGHWSSGEIGCRSDLRGVFRVDLS